MFSVPPPKIAFISGHIDLVPLQFSTNYIPLIASAISNGHHFVLGDALGTDHQALSHLLCQPSFDPRRITVHISRPRNLAKFQAMGVKTFVAEEKYNKNDPKARHVERDKGLTACSDYDILWVRGENESMELYGARYRPRVSATEMNRLRRLETRNFHVVGTIRNT